MWCGYILKLEHFGILLNANSSQWVGIFENKVNSGTGEKTQWTKQKENMMKFTHSPTHLYFQCNNDYVCLCVRERACESAGGSPEKKGKPQPHMSLNESYTTAFQAFGLGSADQYFMRVRVFSPNLQNIMCSWLAFLLVTHLNRHKHWHIGGMRKLPPKTWYKHLDSMAAVYWCT